MIFHQNICIKSLHQIYRLPSVKGVLNRLVLVKGFTAPSSVKARNYTNFIKLIHELFSKRQRSKNDFNTCLFLEIEYNFENLNHINRLNRLLKYKGR